MDTSSITGFNYRLTELQATFGIEQLKKLNKLKKNNKEKYNILNNYISKKFAIRKIPKKSELLCDCFIFKVDEEKKKK
jgi:dTDP-4-amino-4,6-dideoxygalactose transaminase